MFRDRLLTRSSVALATFMNNLPPQQFREMHLSKVYGNWLFYKIIEYPLFFYSPFWVSQCPRIGVHTMWSELLSSTGCPNKMLTPFGSDLCNISTIFTHYYFNKCLKTILSFKMKFIWSKSTTPMKSYDYQKINHGICLVRSCVFYPIENQSKIIVVYISMEKSDQTQF